MSTSALIQALMAARTAPQDTGYGIGAQSIGMVAPSLITSTSSRGRDLGIGLGTMLTQAILGGLAKRQAASENAALFDAFGQYQAGDKTAADRVPALKPIVMALQIGAKEEEAARLAKQAAARDRIDYAEQARLNTEKALKPADFITQQSQARILAQSLGVQMPGEEPAAQSQYAAQPPSTDQAETISPLMTEPDPLTQAGQEELFKQNLKMTGDPKLAVGRVSQMAEIAQQQSKAEKEADAARKKEAGESAVKLFDAANRLEATSSQLGEALDVLKGDVGMLSGPKKKFERLASGIASEVGVSLPENDKTLAARQTLDTVSVKDWVELAEILKGSLSNSEGNRLMTVPPSDWKTEAESRQGLTNMRTAAKIARFEGEFLQRGSELGLGLPELKRAYGNYKKMFPLLKGTEAIDDHLDLKFGELDRSAFETLLAQ